MLTKCSLFSGIAPPISKWGYVDAATHVGVPRLGVVRVDNRLKNENLKLISISGNTVHFHSSFFADKVIGPESNTTFEVVFLSRVEGLVESNLYIHTSKGLFKYYVRNEFTCLPIHLRFVYAIPDLLDVSWGLGCRTAYRLKPLVGARIPVNGSYEPLIMMHNTHDTRIQVVEMFSSGADFHLQLPDEVEKDTGSAWAIDPFETKPVMKGSFLGKADGNHTGFIKIRVNSTASSSEYLLLPVEVQVSSEPGMYSPQDSLDFGLLVQSDKPKTLSLFIINAERRPVNIQSVSVKGPPNPAVKIEFRPLVIEPDNSVSTVVALVTFDPSLAQDPKYSHGMIQILSECGKTVTVPFRATVMHGELEYNASSLGFFVKSDHIPPRNFSVLNNFSATVAIYHVAVSHPDLVQVNSFNQTHIIPPGEQKTIFSMKIQRKREICDTRNKIEVTVKSNITNIKLPLTCYDGKLQMHMFENGEIDCGRIEMYSTHTEYFSLENKNPVEIRLKSWGSNSSWGHVELVGMQKGVKEDLERIKEFDSLKKSLFLQPGHMAVFSIDVRRPTTEGTFFGEAYVTTDHNQTLRVPFRFAVSKGSVYADTFVFDKVFPGKISCEKLYLGSSYNRTLLLHGIRSRPQNLLWFTPSPSDPEILPMRRSYVGKIHFDPRKFCDADCYTGFTMESTFGKLWTKAVRLGWEGGEVDWDIFSTLQKRFEFVSDTTVSNISVWVDTNEVGGYKILTQVNYIWPRVSSLRPVLFPLTALGNESIVEIPVSNPSSFPLVVQATLASDYGPQWTKYPSGLNINGWNFSAGENAFKLSGVLSSSSQQNSSTEISEIQSQLFREILGLKDKSLPGVSFVLPPGAKFFLRTSFRPHSKDIANTVILLRNNLTGIEVISAKGRAARRQWEVGTQDQLCYFN
ncbi:Transmembrane protein [Orchesella cincta]|uniref:Transmembrane protein n=1 Tax=Orchesella cincta TaxID=48709 RepID=A0A1D2N4C5_ORCCI|nr:Transmembrane protein [Orchesella cincta]